MTDQLSPSRHIQDLRVNILSDHEWSICDRRIPTTNAESVLGYIEQRGECFEVMRLSSPRTLLNVRSFEAAQQCFVDERELSHPPA